MTTANLAINLRREYWENRTWLFVIPAILAVIFICLAFLLSQHFMSMTVDDAEVNIFHGSATKSKILDFSEGAEPFELGVEGDPGNETLTITKSIEVQHNNGIDSSALDMISIFLASAWLVGFFYLLSCLYNDRKDNSVLFWKSLPVAELENVLAKFIFGVFGFALAALLIAWLCWFVIYMLSLVSPGGEMIRSEFSLAGLFQGIVYPPLLVVLGVIRGLPLLGLALLASASAKRSPVMVLLIPLGAILLSEKLLFSTNYLFSWLAWHIPFMTLENEAAGGSDVLVYQFMVLVYHPLQLFSGLAVGVAAILAAIWCREHRFEI